MFDNKPQKGEKSINYLLKFVEMGKKCIGKSSNL